ncbi:hypothetical protein [Desulfoscipio gibsoniae]
MEKLFTYESTGLSPEQVKALAEENEPLFDVNTCRVCGCTDDNACPGGCWWVEPDLCSRCAEMPTQERNTESELTPAFTPNCERNNG